MNTSIKRAAAAFSCTAIVAAAFIAGQASADQPRMHEALGNLRQARANLVAANADKGGNRMAAIRHVDAAIASVERGIAFDRRH